ncbi:unnamed protein product [Arctogadus glacialis]
MMAVLTLFLNCRAGDRVVIICHYMFVCSLAWTLKESMRVRFFVWVRFLLQREGSWKCPAAHVLTLLGGAITLIFCTVYSIWLLIQFILLSGLVSLDWSQSSFSLSLLPSLSLSPYNSFYLTPPPPPPPSLCKYTFLTRYPPWSGCQLLLGYAHIKRCKTPHQVFHLRQISRVFVFILFYLAPWRRGREETSGHCLFLNRQLADGLLLPRRCGTACAHTHHSVEQP